MKLTMLGTGNALTTELYNTCFILEDEDNGQLFMTDGGGGNTILRQIKYAGYNWKNIKNIFVTHKHIDHLLGVMWLVRMICQFMSHGDYEGDANIYSHGEVLELLREMAVKLLQEKEAAFVDKRLHMVEVSDGEKRNIIGHETVFFDIKSTKAKQYGFCMDIGEGRKLTCCGDEPLTSAVERYAEGSEWLFHEAFCLYSQSNIFEPYEKHHSTVKDACELAERLRVKNLLLYHTEDKNFANRKEMYKKEGQQYYHGSLWIPNDLEVIKI